ncbi:MULTISPECIES: SDR family oxidoreductase [Brachybacterium]|uniref:Gluconate 5-dehydrogenase n=2 Tax=Brachybacterium TaxID=43668 RepID=A0A3R8RWW0_9MICO|nr:MULTISPECIES: SDR family oxidoreductase [Brachybacterium]RRR17604.1 gluconate 5-dehydrogenase [Brachybacterium paraconglomeratum]GLI29871.1 gluconate 5-dehydrogenase [Brachybacterium conglomeratum]GLK05952.1 gluconate 5-dehydrogenase [Brachybacterium conglomeratum]
MSDLFDLTGRTALVTGSTRGIGRALATGLVRAGARVIVHGRDAGRAAAAAEEIAAAVAAERAGAADGTTAADGTGVGAEATGGAGEVPEVLSAGFDVTDPAAVDAALTAIEAAHGTPDVLVNNAGIQRRAPIAEFADEDWDALLATNLSAAFYCARRVARGMIARGSGKIVQIGSVQSQLARPSIAAYSATKGGIAMFTKGLAADLAPHGIQVNTLAPGYFATELTKALVEDEEFSAWVARRTPDGHWGDVEDLVGPLVFLASDASRFVNGQTLHVDGGMTAVV